MKDNTFYRSAMDGGEWYIYLFQPSWDHNTYGKFGKTDDAGYINSLHHKDVFERAEEISGKEPFLDNLKQFIIKELFNGK